ncbi:helicase-related protein [Serinibacter arcticus]|uniref:helicase-related protein n=1 Tax=Serinibacter arcticus TaxID=1655435 RepID=UPI0018EE6763|nr:helicase-related protein [Serinibacter arcticus]
MILDEFQRFRNLLDPETGEAAELAHSMFDYPQAKVLLLSATPYKPFTRAGEDEEDHYEDFLSTVRFLAGGGPGAADGVASALRGYRTSLVLGHGMDEAARGARLALLPLMSRSERPQLAENQDLLRIRDLDGGVPTPEDLTDWAALQNLGEVLGASIDLEYWKSIPYFASFMEGYRPAEKARDLLKGPDGERVERVLAEARTLSRDAVEEFREIDLGNGYLRSLASETVGAGWWRLLWMPASMPYLEPGSIFGEFEGAELTKRVIFSAWSGVPTAVASLLSYETDRHIAGSGDLVTANTPEARRAVPPRLSYALRDGQATAMSALSLFWPHPALASLADPLAAARAAGRRLSADEMLDVVRARLGADRLRNVGDDVDDGRAWEAYFGTRGALPAELVDLDPDLLVASLRNDDDDESGLGIGFREHVRSAVAQMDAASTPHHDLPLLALHAPGNVALRALRTVAGENVSDRALWTAALELANGVRALFNRPESIALLTGIYGDDRDRPYWRSVLDYCADGNLQAVLDEYAFQLHSELGGGELDDAGLASLASASVGAIEIRPARYVAHDATRERREIPMRARFALRYGGQHASDTDDVSGARQAEVRASFNSPFAPFVLASTSVGQEGIDFHWWSHSVVHWNLPSNPVDFEQREGRVNRFAGHAVRKNVASAHWVDVLRSSRPDPWGVVFDAALEQDTGLGEFSPWWVYPGPARIERVIATYPLSRDHAKYDRLRDALTLYRLTLGQPRQEDMVELLRKRGVDGGAVPTIDLRPPTNHSPAEEKR